MPRSSGVTAFDSRPDCVIRALRNQQLFTSSSDEAGFQLVAKQEIAVENADSVGVARGALVKPRLERFGEVAELGFENDSSRAGTP